MKKQKGSVQLAMIAIVGVIILGLLGAAAFLFDRNQKLVADGAKKDVVIEVQQDGIQKDAKSDKVNEDVSTGIVLKKDEQGAKVETAKRKTQEKVEKINKDAQTATAKATSEAEKVRIETERINLVSSTRLRGLWDTYCVVQPSDESCKKPPAGKASYDAPDEPLKLAASTRLTILAQEPSDTVVLGAYHNPASFGRYH